MARNFIFTDEQMERLERERNKVVVSDNSNDHKGTLHCKFSCKMQSFFHSDEVIMPLLPVDTNETAHDSPDFCASQPCSNGGTCLSQSHGATCNCPPGFTGTTCGHSKLLTLQ